MPIDFSSALGVTLSLVPELVLCAASLVALLVCAWRHATDEDSRFVGHMSLVGLAATAAALGWLWNSGATALAGAPPVMALDLYRYAADGLFLLAAAFTVVVSLSYNGREGLRAPEFYPLVLIATAGMMFMGGANDLIVLFLGLEVMSVAVYVLVAFSRRSEASAEGAIKYFLIGAFASGFLLYGIALIYGATGSTNLAVVAERVLIAPNSFLVSAGIGLLLIGFAFKVAAVPFHMWAPDAYDGAPTPITGFMASGVKAAAFVALMRLLVVGFAPAREVWQPVVGVLAVLTMVVGALIALAQPSLKRMLAYSSINHAGYLLAGVWAGTAAAASAVLLQLLAYTLTTLAAFGILAGLGDDGERDVSLGDIAGFWREQPWTAFALMVCMLSLLGFPGTLGFIGKYAILVAMVAEGHWLIPTVLVLATVVSAGYYLPVIMAAWMKPTPTQGAAPFRPLARPTAAAVAISVGLTLVLGFWPTGAFVTADRGADALVQAAAPLPPEQAAAPGRPAP